MAQLSHNRKDITSNGSWEDKVTQDKKTRGYSFKTAGKYVDQDIDFQITVKDAVIDNDNAPTAEVNLGEISVSDTNSLTTTDASKGIAIGVSVEASVDGVEANVKEAGWIDADSSIEVNGSSDSAEKTIYIKKADGVEGDIDSIGTPTVEKKNGKYEVSADISTSTTGAGAGWYDGTEIITDLGSKVVATLDAAQLEPRSASASVSHSPLNLGDATDTAPAEGPYIAVAGSGVVGVKTEGYIDTNYGTMSSPEAHSYYSIIPNSLDVLDVSGVSNVDGTAEGVDSVQVTVDVPAGYYVGGQIKKDISDLLPDFDSNEATADYILNGYKAYNDEGEVIIGTVSSKGAASYRPSTEDQTIDPGVYLSGAQTIKAVEYEVDASKIAAGSTVKIGDAEDATSIASVTGTFTAPDTVSEGQTAATAADLLVGTSAWVNGQEIKGSIQIKEPGDITTVGPTVTVPPGYYDETATATVTLGSVVLEDIEITANPVLNSTPVDGKYKVTVSGNGDIEPTVTEGYVTAVDSKEASVVGELLLTQSTGAHGTATNALTLPTGGEIEIGAGYYHEVRKIKAAGADSVPGSIILSAEDVTANPIIGALNPETGKYTVSYSTTQTLSVADSSVAGYIDPSSIAPVQATVSGSLELPAAGAPTAMLTASSDTTTYPSGYSALTITAKAGYNAEDRTGTIDVYQGEYTIN